MKSPLLQTILDFLMTGALLTADLTRQDFIDEHWITLSLFNVFSLARPSHTIELLDGTPFAASNLATLSLNH